MTKFSIIVPVYNVSKYLCQCMDSIVNQTYSNLEIICIDDGSTDSSGQILDDYAAKDERIRVIHKDNAGYGHSINRGIELATGDYIGIVESDDYIALDMYEKLAQIIEQAQDVLDVVKTSYFCYSEFDCKKQDIFDADKCGRVISPKDYIGLFAVPCSVWSAVYRREFLLNNKIDFLETPGASYQDTAFTFKVWAVAEKVFLLDEALLYYRVDNAGSSVKSSGKITCVCDEVQEIERYMQEHGLNVPFLEGAKGVYIYRTYMWNYYRLHVAVRAVFWGKMIRKFQELKGTIGFQKKYWTEQIWNDINYILADPEKYFWEINSSLEDFELDRGTIKERVYADAIEGYLQKQNDIVIYGAGIYGRKVLQYLKEIGLQDHIRCFAVTNGEDVVKEVDSIEVQSIKELSKKRKHSLVIVAVAKPKQSSMLQILKDLQFENVLRVDDAFISLMK